MRRTWVRCRARGRLSVIHHGRGLAAKRAIELVVRGLAHLPSTVVRIGAFDFVIRRRVRDFTALVAEIESQIFSGIGFRFAVSEAAIERIVGLRFLPDFLVSTLRADRALPLESGARLRLLLLGFRWLGANFRPGRNRSIRDSARVDDVAFYRGLESARARARGTNRARRLRFTLGLRWRRAGLRTFADTGSALNTWPHREHLKVGVSSGRTRSSIR